MAHIEEATDRARIQRSAAQGAIKSGKSDQKGKVAGRKRHVSSRRRLEKLDADRPSARLHVTGHGLRNRGGELSGRGPIVARLPAADNRSPARIIRASALVPTAGFVVATRLARAVGLRRAFASVRNYAADAECWDSEERCPNHRNSESSTHRLRSLGLLDVRVNPAE